KPRALRQLQIGSIVECHRVFSRERKYVGIKRMWRMSDRHSLQPIDCKTGPLLGRSTAPLADEHRVSYLKPPMRRYDRVVLVDQQPGARRYGMGFVGENPTGRHRSVEDERHYRRPSSRQARISSAVTRGAVLRIASISAM